MGKQCNIKSNSSQKEKEKCEGVGEYYFFTCKEEKDSTTETVEIVDFNLMKVNVVY